MIFLKNYDNFQFEAKNENANESALYLNREISTMQYLQLTFSEFVHKKIHFKIESF